VEKMSTTEKFCLRWNDFETNISGAFKELREEKDFFDVTLACENEQLQAHKLILSACSPFFRTILRRNKHEHPLLYLKGVNYANMVSVLNFMYHGEVNVAQEELNSFLAIAEDLQVKGLTQTNSSSEKSESRHDTPPKKAESHFPSKGPRFINQNPTILNKTQPTVMNHKTDSSNDYQEEIIPIKSEPVSQQPENPNQNSLMVSSHPSENRYSTNSPTQSFVGTVADPTVEYNEDYGEYEDYGTPDASFDASGIAFDQSGYKDLESLVQSFIQKTFDDFNSPVWQCIQCGKISKVSTNLKDHIEAKHITGLQFECIHCKKVFKTRPSLRTHMRSHK